MGRESIKTKDVWTRCLIETDYFIGYQIYVIFKSCNGGILHGDIAPRSYKFLTENSSSRCEITPRELFDEDASDFKTNRSYCCCSCIHSGCREQGNHVGPEMDALPLMLIVHSAEKCYQFVCGGIIINLIQLWLLCATILTCQARYGAAVLTWLRGD